MRTESIEVIFLSRTADSSTEHCFERLRSDFPLVKRIHGTFAAGHLLQLCKAAASQDLMALVNYDGELLGEYLEPPAELRAKLSSYPRVKYIRTASIPLVEWELEERPLATGKMDIVYLTFDEAIAEENFLSLLDRYPDLKRLHGIPGLTSAFRLSASLAVTEWYILIDGDNELLPEVNLHQLTRPDEPDEVKIYFSRNPVNDLEYGYGGVKICPTAKFRRISNDTIDPICSGGLRPVFDRDRLIVSLTRFNLTAFGAWKAGFRECAMLSANADGLNRSGQDWALKKIESWQKIGADRPNGEWAMRGAAEGEQFGRAAAFIGNSLAVINDPQWLKIEFERRHSLTLKPSLRLCSVIGDNPALLNHFIRHYQALGVTDFDLIVHVPDSSKAAVQGILQQLQAFHITPAAFLYGEWNGLKASQMINIVIARRPENWFIIADSDEFQVYPEMPEQLIREADDNGLSYITGCLIDRLGPDGQLTAPLSEPDLWQQYPLAGFVSFPLMRANPYKIVLCKGNKSLAEGQHGILVPEQPYPLKNVVRVQVHHFKWTLDITRRLRDRLEAIENGGWEGCYLGYGQEIERLLQHLREHQGGFNLREGAFLLASAGSSFADYVPWTKVLNNISSWSVLTASPQL